MIGKIIGAYAGDKLAKQTSALGGASGAALGVVAASVLRRMSLPAMLAIGAGGFLAKKAMERDERKSTYSPATKTGTTSTGTAKAA